MYAVHMNARLGNQGGDHLGGRVPFFHRLTGDGPDETFARDAEMQGASQGEKAGNARHDVEGMFRGLAEAYARVKANALLGQPGFYQGIHARADATMIMVSHSMTDVIRLCNRIVVINQGELALDGAPSEVFAQGDALRAMGLDTPPCAKLREALASQGFSLPDDAYAIDSIRGAILQNFGLEGK